MHVEVDAFIGNDAVIAKGIDRDIIGLRRLGWGNAEIIGKHLKCLGAILLHETSAAQRGPHNFLDLLPLGLELFLHDRDPRERQLDDIAQVDEPPKAFVFRLHRKGHVDRSGVDGARSKRRQGGAGMLIMACRDDEELHLWVPECLLQRRLISGVLEPAVQQATEITQQHGLLRVPVRYQSQRLAQRLDRRVEVRRVRRVTLDIPGDERLDGDRRLHLNFVCLQSLVFKESLANGDDRGKLKQPATRCADHDSLRGRSSINKWWYTPRKNRSQQENQQLRRSEIRSHDWTSTPSVHSF